MGLFRRKPKKVREKVDVNIGIQASPSVKLITDDDPHWQGVVKMAPVIEIPGSGWQTVKVNGWYADTYWSTCEWYEWHYVAAGADKIYGIDNDVLRIWDTMAVPFELTIPAASAPDAKTAMAILREEATAAMERRKHFWNNINEIVLRESRDTDLVNLAYVADVEVEK